MNLTNPEAKVGLFTLIALLAMLLLFFWLNGIQLFQKGTEVEAIFEHIEGLRPGATVKFAGVDVGRVSRIYFDDLKVVVVIRIQSGFEIPHPAKVVISSSGIIGDKFLEIIPAKPGEVIASGDRLMGQNPVSMEQFYTTAFDVLESLRTVTDSIKYFIADPEVAASLKSTVLRLNEISGDIQKITNQLQDINLVGLFDRIQNITLMVERMAQKNEPQLNEFMVNITKISAQLAQASITANRFLSEMEYNGQTAADLRQTIANAEKISANLEKFTAILAIREKDINSIIDDAHQAIQAIKQAADNVNKAIEQLISGEGSLSQVKYTIGQTSQAVSKVTDYINAIEQIALKNSLGVGFQEDSIPTVDYKMDLSLNSHHSLLIGFSDIGEKNLATLQWAFKSPNHISRVGLYQSKFGLGFDLPVSSNLTVGTDIWDIQSPNFDLISNWKFSSNWSMSLGGATNLDTREDSWNLELWRDF